MSARGTAECIHPLSIIANQDHTSPASPFDFAQTWASWRDLRLKDKVLPNQGLHVREIVRRLILCRDPDGGHARHVCPGCAYDRRIPFSCKTCFCPSCGKVRVDNWVAYVAPGGVAHFAALRANALGDFGNPEHARHSWAVAEKRGRSSSGLSRTPPCLPVPQLTAPHRLERLGIVETER